VPLPCRFSELHGSGAGADQRRAVLVLTSRQTCSSGRFAGLCSNAGAVTRMVNEWSAEHPYSESATLTNAFAPLVNWAGGSGVLGRIHNVSI